MRPDPIPLLKQQLGRTIAAELRGCPSYDAAATLRTDASRVADLRRERLARFSLETLIRYAERLGLRVSVQASGGAGVSWKQAESVLPRSVRQY